jgi:hypothetical protein
MVKTALAAESPCWLPVRSPERTWGAACMWPFTGNDSRPFRRLSPESLYRHLRDRRRTMVH